MEDLFSSPTPKPYVDPMTSQSLDDLENDEHRGAFSSRRDADPHESIDWQPHTATPIVPSASYDNFSAPKQNGVATVVNEESESRRSTPRTHRSHRESPRSGRGTPMSHTDTPTAPFRSISSPHPSNRSVPSGRQTPERDMSNHDSPRSDRDSSQSEKERSRPSDAVSSRSIKSKSTHDNNVEIPIEPMNDVESTRSIPVSASAILEHKEGILLDCEPHVIDYIAKMNGRELGQIERDYDVKLRVHRSAIEVISVDDTDLTAELARDKLSEFCKATAQEIVTEIIELPPGEKEAEIVQGVLAQV